MGIATPAGNSYAGTLASAMQRGLLGLLVFALRAVGAEDGLARLSHPRPGPFDGGGGVFGRAAPESV